MGFVATLDEPFLLSPSGASPLVPAVYDVSIDGQPFLLDTSFEPYRRDAFRHRTIPNQRTASDISNIQGEASINTAGLWRRTAEDWRGGSGQIFFDRAASDPARFRTSKGVNPWFPWQLTLLPDTSQVLAAADSTLQVLCVGAYCYVMTSTALKFSTNLSSWTTVTGTPTACKGIATDGFDIWIAGGAQGIYSTTKGAASASAVVTGTVNLIGFVGQRLMAAAGASVYNVTTLSGALPTALMVHPNTDWVWTAFAQGSGQIYMAGFSGNVSEVWRTAVETGGFSAGVALTSPILSAPLPQGEIVYSARGYANVVVLGTSAGVRLCTTLSANDPGGNAGDLRLGSIVPNLSQPVTKPVKAICGQNQFVWFGWSNYDSVSTGLGRFDITRFTGDQTPAYATDLMATTQGEIISADWFGSGTTFNGLMTSTDCPVFAVSGVGIYAATNTYVASGTLNQGYEIYGIEDQKIALYYDLKPQLPLVGTIGAAISIDQGAFQSLGTFTAGQTVAPFTIAQLKGEYLEPQIQLTSLSPFTSTPTILRGTLKAWPAIVSGIEISPVIDCYTSIELGSGVGAFADPYQIYNFILNLYLTQKIVQYVEGPLSFQVVVDAFDWLPHAKIDTGAGGFQGVCVVYCKTITG